MSVWEHFCLSLPIKLNNNNDNSGQLWASRLFLPIVLFGFMYFISLDYIALDLQKKAMPRCYKYRFSKR